MTESKKEEIRCFHNFLKENNLEETKLLRNIYSDAFAHGFGEGVCLASKKANYDLKKTSERKRLETMTKIDLAKKFKKNGYDCSLDIDCGKCRELTGYDCLQDDVKPWCNKILSSSYFEEWKAINSARIEELADYFMAHDTQHFFTGDKYKEAYEKIESLLFLAFERK